jgi:hypothetical protein
MKRRQFLLQGSSALAALNVEGEVMSPASGNDSHAQHVAGLVTSTTIAVNESPKMSVISEWNESLLSAARKETTPPCLVALKLAILHKAIHLAMANVPGEQPPFACVQAALTIASNLYPSAEASFRELAMKQLGHMKPHPQQADQLSTGKKIAESVLDERKGDGSSTAQPYIPSDKAGQWRRTPPAMRPPELPHWANVTKPFLLTSAEQFRPPPSPGLTSAEYAKAWDEVRRRGSKNSTERTADQTRAAHFWSDFSYTETPPGHWNSIARGLCLRRNLSLVREARLFYLLNASLADAALACWDAKYHYNTWRPITAIVRAAEDGNEGTAPEADWQSLLGNPPHPEYVSGHSTFSGAAAEVLRHHFGTDKLSFDVTSDTLKEIKRSFKSLASCVEEISKSRIWGGIHFPFSCNTGITIGKSVAKECLKMSGF